MFTFYYIILFILLWSLCLSQALRVAKYFVIYIFECLFHCFYLLQKPDSSSPQKRISRQRRASESTQGTNSDVDIQSPEKTPKSANKKKGHLMVSGYKYSVFFHLFTKIG